MSVHVLLADEVRIGRIGVFYFSLDSGEGANDAVSERGQRVGWPDAAERLAAVMSNATTDRLRLLIPIKTRLVLKKLKPGM